MAGNFEHKQKRQDDSLNLPDVSVGDFDSGAGDSDSVYEETYQNIDNRQHPLLRASKLTKRIRRDRKISVS